MYGKARCLIKLAEKERSNKLLEEAVAMLQKVVDAKDAPKELVRQAGLLLGEKLEFRGKVPLCIAFKFIRLTILCIERMSKDR